jgi:hypothetical protein
MSNHLADLARHLIDEASQRGVTLRLTGSMAVRTHCAPARDVLEQVGREPPQDVDLFALSRQDRDIRALFKSLGFEPDPSLALSHEYGLQRLIYYAPADRTKVEVFLDMLYMSHTLDFRARLGVDSPTLSVADLLLAKLQIHEITEKDIQDVIALLATHELAAGEREAIDLPYLLGLFRQDWGLYYTAKKNLALVREHIDRYDSLPAPARETAGTRVQTLGVRIEAEPKALRWRARAAVGTRVPWYQEVRDVEQR